MNEEENIQDTEQPADEQPFDYDHVKSVARIAAYDDLSSAPRVTIIEPAPTDEFITNLATKIYEQAKTMGGNIPFTIIKEVSENFIHAKFEEMTVSILDEGNTIRFADQGPGINNKDKAKLPGFSSAVEPMKQYIRGVGSGLPIVQDYFDEKHGTVTIDDNVLRGAVVTISLKNVDNEEEERFKELENRARETQYAPVEHADFEPHYESHREDRGGLQSFEENYQQAYPQQAPQYAVQQPQQYQNAAAYQQDYGYQPYPQQPYQQQMPQQGVYPQQGFYQAAPQMPVQQQSVTMVGNNNRVPMYIPQATAISERGKQCLRVLQSEGVLGVTEISALTGIPQASVFNELKKLEESGFIEKTAGKKRMITNIGMAAANNF